MFALISAVLRWKLNLETGIQLSALAVITILYVSERCDRSEKILPDCSATPQRQVNSMGNSSQEANLVALGTESLPTTSPVRFPNWKPRDQVFTMFPFLG